MKTQAFLHLFFLTCLFTACSHNAKTGGTTAKEEADSVVFMLENERIVNYIRAEVPQETMALAVGEWLDEALGGYYPGDACDMQALVDFYGKAIADTLETAASESFSTTMEFKAIMAKTYETDLLVTYTLSTFTGLGGAHPTSAEQGATFRKSDGRRLGWDIVRNYMRYELNEVLKEGLTNYFGAENDDELDRMLIDYSIYNIPLTNTPPYFLENGIAYIYQQYEITGYAMGMPSDTIPYNQMEPLMTEWAKRLIPRP